MATVDQYVPTTDSYLGLAGGGNNVTGAGQAFTGNGGVLDDCILLLDKSGNPTGTINARIYAHSGTFGASSVPGGSALAVSDGISVSGLSGTPAEKIFNFSGANKITLAGGTKYVLTVEHNGGTGGDTVNVHALSTSPAHAGNSCYLFGSWTEYASDLYFKVVSDDAAAQNSNAFLVM